MSSGQTRGLWGQDAARRRFTSRIQTTESPNFFAVTRDVYNGGCGGSSKMQEGGEQQQRRVVHVQLHLCRADDDFWITQQQTSEI